MRGLSTTRVLLIGLVAAYLAATFNPNDYKADIVKAAVVGFVLSSAMTSSARKA